MFCPIVSEGKEKGFINSFYSPLSIVQFFNHDTQSALLSKQSPM